MAKLVQRGIYYQQGKKVSQAMSENFNLEAQFQYVMRVNREVPKIITHSKSALPNA